MMVTNYSPLESVTTRELNTDRNLEPTTSTTSLRHSLESQSAPSRINLSTVYNPATESSSNPYNTPYLTNDTSATTNNSWDLIKSNIWAKLYIACTVIFNFAVISLEAVIFAWFQNASKNTNRCTGNNEECTPEEVVAITFPIYLALFLFAGTYQIIIGIWALKQRNTIQLTFLVFFSIAMMVYGAIQFDQIKDASILPGFQNPQFISGEQVTNLLIAVVSITGVECVFQIFLTYKLYRGFTHDIFHTYGASVKQKLILRDYLFFEAVIIFDVFFFVGFTLQFIIVVLQTNDVEFFLTIVVIPLTIVVLGLALFFVRREQVSGVYFFLVVCFAGMAYFLFKLIRVYIATGEKGERYARAKKTLTVFAAITLAFLILTIYSSLKCLRNFGKGLKEARQRVNGRNFQMHTINSGTSVNTAQYIID